MNPLLHHVDQITRYRNRGNVEVGVITALNEILGVQRIELYKIFMPPGDVLVGLSAEIGAGDTAAVTHDDGFSWPENTGSIESFTYLQAAFATDAPVIDVADDGMASVVLMLRTDRHDPYAFLRMVRPRPLDAVELDIVHGFAALLRNCLSLLDYSETDTLTGLLNRKTFDEYLIKILANTTAQDDSHSGALHLPHRRHFHAEAHDHWLGVMDIDKFKSINDRFGHLIGDEVLILMANLMRESFRVQDKLFRFGGEEFVALLRPAEFDHAWRTFERFRQRVESFDFPQVGHVTVSIGFTRIKLGDTPSVILDSADEALYWAKEHGRNQCHAYQTLVDEGRLQPLAAPTSEVEFF